MTSSVAAPLLVLFDFDGVLVHYAHEARLRVLAERSGCDADAVAVALFHSGLEAAADLGEYDAQGQVDELVRRLGAPLTLADCIAARCASVAVEPAVLALAEAVAGQAEVAILTNNGLMLRDHLPEICPPLFPRFTDRVFCSAQFGCEKPASEIFRRCLRALGVTPQDALFIDDRQANIDGARSAGLRAHHYRTPSLLRRELQSLGLLPESAPLETSNDAY